MRTIHDHTDSTSLRALRSRHQLDIGTQLLLSFESQGSALTGILLFFGFLIAERIGDYVEGPFDQDGSSFSMPLNTICMGINEDLMPRQLDYGQYRPSQNPVF